MEQEGLGDEARLIFITHSARERDVQATLHDLRELDVGRRRCGDAAAGVDERLVKYVSTRGDAPVLEFADVLLAGLARDGGLYVPETLAGAARLDARPGRRPTPDAAAAVMAPFVEGDDRAGGVRRDSSADAYVGFDHPDVCPLVELGDGLWLLELFHGPTLAFKDVALQLVGRLFDDELARRGERVTIVVATSGDTGSAAIEACVGPGRLDIVVLHPAGRVSRGAAAPDDDGRRRPTCTTSPSRAPSTTARTW